MYYHEGSFKVQNIKHCSSVAASLLGIWTTAKLPAISRPQFSLSLLGVSHVVVGMGAEAALGVRGA
jgi:hypothetical protein